MNYSLST